MTRGTWFVAVALIVAVFVGSILVYGKLPERILTHWNLRGEVDGFGSRAVGVLLLPIVLVGLVGLFAVLSWMSPTSFKMDGFRATYGAIVIITLTLLSFIHVLALTATLGYRVDMTRFIVAAALFALGLMGNFLGKVRRNFFIGFRVPWTLANERIWNETHRLAAWVMFGCGFLGSAVALAGHPLVGQGLILPIVIVPILFSLYRYKQLEARGEV